MTSSITFTGDYRTFSEAFAACNDAGYSGDAAINRYVRRYKEVSANPHAAFAAATEQVLRFMAAFSVAQPINGVIEVLDHGGGYGAIYEIFRTIYPLTPMRWTIVELPALVARADEMGASETKRFCTAIPHQRWSFVITSGTIQCLPDPNAAWREIDALNTDVLLVNRFPLAPWLTQDRLVIETVPPEMFAARFPTWFFSATWAARLTASRKQIARWDAPGDETDLDGRRLHYQAFLLGPRHHAVSLPRVST